MLLGRNMYIFNLFSLLAFWNLIEVQINNSMDAALSPLRDFSIEQNPKRPPSESIPSR